MKSARNGCGTGETIWRGVLDFGELRQPVRRDTTRFFGTVSKVPMNWAAPAIKPEPLEPQPATSPKCAVAVTL